MSMASVLYNNLCQGSETSRASTATKSKAPPSSQEENESKKRRKQQVLAMLADEPPAPVHDPTPISAAEYSLNTAATGSVKITGLNLKKSTPATAAPTNNRLFANTAEDAEGVKAVRTVVPIDYSEEEKQAAAALQVCIEIQSTILF